MRNTALLLLIAGILSSCNKVNPEHQFKISGVLMDNCEHQNPVGGEVVQFDLNGETFASAKTNAYGEFSLEGTAVEKGGGQENVAYLAINYTAQDNGGFFYKKLAILPFTGAALDTLYYNGTERVQMSLATSGAAYSEKDTLFIRYSVPYSEEAFSNINSYGHPYMLKYAGPFTQGILDTVLMQGHSHPKYHDDEPQLITYWVNDYQEWRDELNKPFRVRYSEKGIVDKPSPGCGEITPALIEL